VIALTHGVFDLIHAGHMEHLKQCAGLCDRLIVSVVADRYVTKKFIIQDERTRMFQVSMVKGVDEVILCDDYGPWNLLRSLKPDIYIRKDEYMKKEAPEYSVANELGIVCLFTKTVLPHTKDIVQRIWKFKGFDLSGEPEGTYIEAGHLQHKDDFSSKEAWEAMIHEEQWDRGNR